MELPHVAIPSYKRTSVCLHKTLKTLFAAHYPQSKITIFVADDEEAVAYRQMLRHTMPAVSVVVGRRGLQPQRAFIADYYPDGDTLLCMDDDVDGIKTLHGTDFCSLIRSGMKALADNQSGLWGVLPNDDGRKMKDETTKHLTHILGSFFLCVNRKDLVPTQTEKEDYERSILYFKAYGSVLRYKGAGVQTTYMLQGGGLNTGDRKAEMSRGALALRQMYPAAVKVITKKDLPDVSLNWRCKVDEIAASGGEQEAGKEI